MRKIFIILLMLLMFTKNIYANGSIKEPNVEAQGAVLIDELTGRILWEKNAHTQMSMASTTKIMTAIIALERGNMDDTVTVSKKSQASPKVKMNLTNGEQIKLEYLMYALMLQSYNDAAVAIAEHVGGSIEEFCNIMTEKAKEIGAYNTSFKTPSGLDADGHYSTPYDMAIIARYALQNKDFIKITNRRDISVSSNKRSYSLVNKNRLLNQMHGAKGVKTGFTGKAGHCFVGAVERDEISLISVVLGSGWGNNRNQKWIHTKEILDYGFLAFSYKNIVDENDNAKSVLVGRSREKEVDIAFRNGLNLPLSEEEYNNIHIEIVSPNLVNAPIIKGQEIGLAKVYINNKLENEIALISVKDVARHDLKTSIEKVLNAWFNLAGKGDIILPEFKPRVV